MLNRLFSIAKNKVSAERDTTPAALIPATTRAEAALRAGRPGEAVDIIIAAVDTGELAAENCIPLAQFLLAMQAFDEVERICRPPARSQLLPSTRIKFESHAAVARAKRAFRSGRESSRIQLPVGPLPVVSVVICSVDPVSFERASRSYQRALARVPHEIIGVHDAKSLCEGNNRGAGRARGDLLLFSHDDVEVQGEDFGARLLEAASAYDLVGIAGTSSLSRAGWITRGAPYIHGQHGVPFPAHIDIQVYSTGLPCVPGMEALDGVVMAARRSLWESHPFDSDSFRGWHMYDLDFSHTAYLEGYRCAVRCDLAVLHYRRQKNEADHADYLRSWNEEAEKFLQKRPELRDKPAICEPDQLCAVSVANDREWLLLLDQLYPAP